MQSETLFGTGFSFHRAPFRGYGELDIHSPQMEGPSLTRSGWVSQIRAQPSSDSWTDFLLHCASIPLHQNLFVATQSLRFPLNPTVMHFLPTFYFSFLPSFFFFPSFHPFFILSFLPSFFLSIPPSLPPYLSLSFPSFPSSRSHLLSSPSRGMKNLE